MSKRDWSNVGKQAFLYSQQLEGYIPALADWVECQAITRVKVGCDKTTLLSALKIDDWQSPTEDIVITHEQLADEVFRELVQRFEDYYSKGYPFKCVDSGRRIVFSRKNPWPYVFLLGLSYTNPAKKPPKGGVPTGGTLLESLAWIGIKRFIGKPSPEIEELAHCYHLGRPSVSGLPGRFDKKINLISKQINEGGGYRRLSSGHTQKSGDNGVDIILRRGFPDGRGAQFLLFGGCAAGADWSTTKRYECDPFRWLTRNFIEPFHGIYGMPRCYILPRQIGADHWEDTAKMSGMLIDRCRLSLITAKSRSKYLKVARSWAESFYGKAF